MLSSAGIHQLSSEKQTTLLNYFCVDGNTRILSFISNGEIKSVDGICCSKDVINISCTLCGIIVNVELDKKINYKTSTKIRNRIHIIHDHSDIYEKLLRAGDVYVGIKEPVECKKGDKILCGICDDNIGLPYYMQRKSQNIDVFSLIHSINDHYKKCKKLKLLACARRSELEGIYAEIVEILKNAEPVKDDVPASNPHIDLVVRKVGKCHCGESDIIGCAICGSQWKSADLFKSNYYAKCIKHHFGKKYIKYDHKDFIHIHGDEKLYLCAICGDNYDNNVAKEVVYGHFKSCVEKHRDYFATHGYKCTH